MLRLVRSALTFAVLGSLATAQDRDALRADLLSLESVAVVDVPRVDVGGALFEDAKRAGLRVPQRFAIPNDVRISPDEHGTWEDLGADRQIWRLRVRGLGARSLNLGFGSYHMPAGGALWIYSPDREHVVRPFTAADNEAHGELWTPVVPVEELVVELVVPRTELDRFRLVLTRIGYGYRGFASPGVIALSQSCNVDVACPEGDPWRLEIPSVGVYGFGGFLFCSGVMLNNARADLRPYFLTADHCGVRPGNASSVVVYWNYENSFCRTPGSPQSGQPGDGPLNQFSSGSTLRSRFVPSDFTLIELDDDPNPAFGVTFAGWDRSGANASSAAGIHHPNTEEKRISFEFDTVRTTSYGGTFSPGDGTHVYVSDWDIGTTESGSSGSPLFNQDHRVIGQLGGGVGTCASAIIEDWYGSFARSWTGGGSNSNRLSNWLDPDATGVLAVDTTDRDSVCTDAGTIALERSQYGCEDTATVLVVDCGPNLDDGVADTVQVTLDSDSEPAGETVVLTETGPATNRFQGAATLSGTNSAGVLLVGEGDTLTARYVDADDGLGGTNVQVTTQGTVDCTPPQILGAALDQIGVTTARLTVTAGEPVVAKADLGTACGVYTGSATGEEPGTTATVTLTGLAPATTYFVRALACDEAGNVGQDDNGGSCYSLTTDEAVNFFTEQYFGDNDLANTALDFVPAPGNEGYVQCTRQAISALPTDPAGGTLLALGDDDFESVALTGGQRVALHGISYPSLFVGSNGYVTFLAGDASFDETPDWHFARRRIAALYDDLDPASGGQVSWRQVADRVAVTWEGVPEAGTSNSNTFQIELFFDGRLRISFLELAATDGLTGLSDGSGLDPEFFETDLSAGPDCGGRRLLRRQGVDGSATLMR